MNIWLMCTGNTCRSPMAEGILKNLIAQKGWDNIVVESFGFGANEGESPTNYAVKAMEEIGIDISDKQSRRVTTEDLVQGDLFYVMTQSHKNILLDAMPELEPRIFVVGVADPFGRELDIYRECRDSFLAYFEEELKNGARFGNEE